MKHKLFKYKYILAIATFAILIVPSLFTPTVIAAEPYDQTAASTDIFVQTGGGNNDIRVELRTCGYGVNDPNCQTGTECTGSNDATCDYFVKDTFMGDSSIPATTTQRSLVSTDDGDVTLVLNYPTGSQTLDSAIYNNRNPGVDMTGVNITSILYNPENLALPDNSASVGVVTPEADATAEESTTTCNIDGIGWIICPVMTFMSKIVDASYSLLENLLLQTQPLNVTDFNSPQYVAWASMRDIANLAFIIAFLFVVFSQLTGVGISNYGIKKMLPKIIIAAILVNISYLLCAIAIDLSNIVGVSMKGLFGTEGIVPVDGIATYSTASTPGGEGDAGVSQVGNAWTDLTVWILAGAGASVIVMYAGITVLLPVLLAVLSAVITVVVVLMMRQAIIILLVVVAPLAFVALLLPNTEGLFKKWKGLFTTMLMMYPIIALIFGASGLASSIIMASSTNIMIQIMGAGIAIIPLFLTPIVMKTSGSLLGKFGGMVNNAKKGSFDKMGKGVSGIRANAKVSRGMRAMDDNRKSMPGRKGFVGWRNKRNAINKGRGEQYEDLKKEDTAKRAVGSDSFARKVAGDKAEIYQERQQSYLDSIDPDKLKLDLDKSQMANMVGKLKLSIEDPKDTVESMKKVMIQASADGDAIKARAAQEILMNTGEKGKDALREALGTVTPTSKVGVELRKDIAASSIKGSAADIYTFATDGTRSMQDISKDKKTWGNLSAVQWQGQTEGSYNAAIGSAKALTAEQAAALLHERGSDALSEKKKELLINTAGAKYTPIATSGAAAGSTTPTATTTPAGTLSIPHTPAPAPIAAPAPYTPTPGTTSPGGFYIPPVSSTRDINDRRL